MRSSGFPERRSPSVTAVGLPGQVKRQRMHASPGQQDALVRKQTYEPISVRIQIAFIWTTIKISNFKSGGITDEMLRFPAEQYKDYKFVDKR